MLQCESHGGDPVTTIKDRYEAVCKRVNAAAARAEVSPSGIHVVAVTKHASMEQVRDLIELGHVDFGENRLQHFTQIAAQVDEYIERRRELGEPDLESPIRWHFIGHLQRNKVRRIIPMARMIHSLDSLRLAEEIQVIAEKRDQVVEVLIQANISGERGKHGIAPAALGHILEQLDTMINIRPRGMMCMAPASTDPETVRPVFERCREIFDELCEEPRTSEAFNVLSMGMSGDFEVAIECGANVVRVGSAIFGGQEGASSEPEEATTGA